MKQITAIIRPEKWEETFTAIRALGVEAVTQHRVLGRGRQRGLRYLSRTSAGGSGDMPFLPKRMFTCMAPDEVASAIVNAIIRAGRTGNVGDGKIFVQSVEVSEQATEAEVSAPAA